MEAVVNLVRSRPSSFISSWGGSISSDDAGSIVLVAVVTVEAVVVVMVSCGGCGGGVNS